MLNLDLQIALNEMLPSPLIRFNLIHSGFDTNPLPVG